MLLCLRGSKTRIDAKFVRNICSFDEIGVPAIGKLQIEHSLSCIGQAASSDALDRNLRFIIRSTEYRTRLAWLKTDIKHLLTTQATMHGRQI